MKRRELIKSAGILSAAPFLSMEMDKDNLKEKKHVLVAGAHPDDPETGCGGTIAYLAEMGHHVTSLYLTKGEAGIEGKSLEEAAAIRVSEAKDACLILNSHPVFFGQVDGDTFINRAEYEKMRNLVKDLQPDIVFTQWPIDTHPDHRIISLLMYDAWLYGGVKFTFYYYEVMSGDQSQIFHPTEYVNISDYVEIKRKACMAHKSQKPEEWYVDVHEEMSHFRGHEAGCEHAEAFILHPQSRMLI